jgi:hypothetical protein
MESPIRREHVSDYYWSLPFYWEVTLLALILFHSFGHSLVELFPHPRLNDWLVRQSQSQSHIATYLSVSQ